jgi:hypothetical protein
MNRTGTEEKSTTSKCKDAHDILKHLLRDSELTGVLSEDDLLTAYVTINYAILGIMADREKIELETFDILIVTEPKSHLTRIIELNNQSHRMKTLTQKTKDLITIALAFNSLLLEGHLINQPNETIRMARAAIRSVAAAYLTNL